MMHGSDRNTTGTHIESGDSRDLRNERPELRFTGTLRLRGDQTERAENNTTQDRHVRWADGVVDNEGQGKKSSKVCCIYHKPRPSGESSSESDSSEPEETSSDESDSDTRPGSRSLGDRSRSSHSCQNSERNLADPKTHHNTRTNDAHGKKKKKKPRANAYERMPKNTETMHG